jgi:hypothetical protein
VCIFVAKVVCISVAKLLCILAKQCVGKGGPLFKKSIIKNQFYSTAHAYYQHWQPIKHQEDMRQSVGNTGLSPTESHRKL